MTRLHQTIVLRFLSSLVAVEPQGNDPVHLILPFLADYAQEALGANVVVGGGIVGWGLVLLDVLFGGGEVGGG